MIDTWILNPKHCIVSGLVVSLCLQRWLTVSQTHMSAEISNEVRYLEWYYLNEERCVIYIEVVILERKKLYNPCLICCLEIIILCLFLANMRKEAFKWLSISKGKSVLTAVGYKSHWRCNIPCLLFIGLLRSDWNKLIMLLKHSRNWQLILSFSFSYSSPCEKKAAWSFSRWNGSLISEDTRHPPSTVTFQN